MIEKVCETCEKPFSVKPWRGDLARFCSMACRKAHEISRRKPKGPAKLPWTEVELAFLHDQLAAGKSGRWIATQLPGRSRTAVANMIWRLDLRVCDATIRHKAVVRELWGQVSKGVIAQRIGSRVAEVDRLATELGLVDTYVTKSKASKPRPTPVPPAVAYTCEQIAWAIENFRTDPNARMIAAIIAGRGKVSGMGAA